MEVIHIGEVTSAGVITAWAILQAVAFEYLWFVKDWYDKYDEKKKRTINGAGIVAITAIVYGLSLGGVIDGFSPDVAGALKALVVCGTALGVGQGVHSGTKRSSS